MPTSQNLLLYTTESIVEPLFDEYLTIKVRYESLVDNKLVDLTRHLEEAYDERMKKKGKQDKQEPEPKEKKKPDDVTDDDDHNQGFSDWLRSVDGIEMMRLFVIANSLIVFITIAWPNMQQTYTIIKDYIMGEEEDL